MANTSLSNKERAEARKRTPKVARHPARPGEPIKVSAAPKPEPADDRDGLLWLVKKRRIKGDRQKAAMAYRAAFRDASGPTIKSALDFSGGFGRGSGTDFQHAAAVGSAHAKRALFALRWNVLSGQDDMLIVMDGVCGIGQSLRTLAGGDSRKAMALEAVLMVALDLIVTHMKNAGEIAC